MKAGELPATFSACRVCGASETEAPIGAWSAQQSDIPLKPAVGWLGPLQPAGQHSEGEMQAKAGWTAPKRHTSTINEAASRRITCVPAIVPNDMCKVRDLESGVNWPACPMSHTKGLRPPCAVHRGGSTFGGVYL